MHALEAINTRDMNAEFMLAKAKKTRRPGWGSGSGSGGCL